MLSREFLNWQWYDNSGEMRVFLHLLLTANYADAKWHGVTIKRGERVVSLQGLSDEIGIPKSTLRDILGRLEASGDIVRTSHSKFTLITLKDYSKYTDYRPIYEQEINKARPKSAQNPPQYNNNNNNQNNNNDKNCARDIFDISFDINELEESSFDRYKKY